MGGHSFTFKQFHIEQDRCAMKVGTDSIVLGSWVPVMGAKRILDIGTEGCNFVSGLGSEEKCH